MTQCIKREWGCRNAECGVSTGIADEATFGSGELSDHGYWEHPCGECARAWEKMHPEDGPCWPDVFLAAEEACRCKHCGRCVLAGPPCCYDKVYEMYQALLSERDWLRKIQSKKDKQINSLKKRLEALLFPSVT